MFSFITFPLGLGDKLHAIVMRILSVKPVLSVVNLPSPAFRRSSAYYTEPQFTDKRRKKNRRRYHRYIDIMKSRCDNESCLRSFSVNCGSV